MSYLDIIVSYSDISLPTMSIHRSKVVCMLDRYETMLTFTEFSAKSNRFRPQEDLTFALSTGYIIVLYPLITKRVAQSASWRAKLIITVIHLLCEYRTLEQKQLSVKQY